MSAAKIRTLTQQIYEGTESFVYPDKEEAYLTETLEKGEREVVGSKNISIFYRIARILSAVIAVGFIVLLVLSLATGEPIHWSIAIMGCLGGIGLSGAIWLSKSQLQN
ncbi:hypothetical protein KA005_67250 [bacterium]|nr:hypothetical protein [bacterium]